MKTDPAKRVRDKGLKATPARLAVLAVLEGDHLAHSHADLEGLFDTMDRVTLYRVLNDFENVGLLHKVIDNAGVTRFGVCKHSCPGEHHVDGHVNFICLNCDKMFCMEDTIMPVLQVKKGFVIQGTQMLICGLCKSCNAA